MTKAVSQKIETPKTASEVLLDCKYEYIQKLSQLNGIGVLLMEYNPASDHGTKPIHAIGYLIMDYTEHLLKITHDLDGAISAVKK